MATVKTDNGVAKVIENLNGAMGRRKAAALVICKRYALSSKQLIRKSQGLEQLKEGAFWTNQTSEAIKGVYGFAIDDKSKDIIGFGLAHHVEYGKYLEGFDKAGNKAREGDRFDKDGNKIGTYNALERTVKAQVPSFMDEIKKVFSD
jgi:hypothetical protein